MFAEQFSVLSCFLLSLAIQGVDVLNVENINIPDEHYPFFFKNFPELAKECLEDSDCRFKDFAQQKQCWGYELNCNDNSTYSTPICPGDHKGWARSKEDHIKRFYDQADFGYVRERLREMQLLCEPLFKEDSSLECAAHLRFCRGRNIMIDFTDVETRTEPLRYAMDVLKSGQIGGYCKFHKSELEKQSDHISPLQSWGPELRNFVSLPERPIESKKCDVVVEKPVFLLKIDATVNMYHHFCDFLNLYASLHLNASHHDMFSRDVHILVWESYSYSSNFAQVMGTFTKNPVWDLKTFRGQKVCFKNIVFPLLPRMIFGLYYNTPIVWGCEKSGLFHAFSKHILHRLHIPLHRRDDSRVHVTLLSRQTKYRRALNEDEIFEKLQQNPNYVVKRVSYSHQMPFREQLELTHNSDVFIGMHGSGLTHLLFLPDWAAVFEIYNCEDEHCYLDLARLRGVKYFTWENPSKFTRQDEGHHPEIGAHAKFTNYEFDIDEFLRIVTKAAEHVKRHQAFKEFTASQKKKRVKKIPALHEEL